MSGLSFVALGVGDAFSALSYSSCLAVHADGAWLLVDCPHPIRKILRESGRAAGVDLDVGSFEAVVVTHLHADHASGLEGFGYFTHFVLDARPNRRGTSPRPTVRSPEPNRRGTSPRPTVRSHEPDRSASDPHATMQGDGLRRRVTLLAHPSVSARLWDGHLAAGMEALMDPATHAVSCHTLPDYFDLRPLSETVPVTAGPFEISCRRTIHHVPTTALRIRAGGRCLGISADTCFDPELLAWLSGADLIVHETNHGVHTPYEKLAALPSELRGRMRLIHYPDDFDVARSAIAPLRQGTLHAV
ncbi:MAG: MBL fold metallo-hydrolase [Acidobacteriota bacterium]